MQTTARIALLIAAIALSSAAVLAQPDHEHQPPPQEPHDPMHGQEPVNPPNPPKDQPPGPSIFASTPVGIVFFVVGIAGWIALGVAFMMFRHKYEHVVKKS
jgi:hypothetical protein